MLRVRFPLWALQTEAEVTLEDFRKGKTLTEADTNLIKRDKRSIEFERSWRPGDSVWHYDSAEEDWARGMGSEGYIIVRDGQIVDTLVMKMN